MTVLSQWARSKVITSGENLTILNEEPSSLKKVYVDHDLQQNGSLGEEHSPKLFKVTLQKTYQLCNKVRSQTDVHTNESINV